MIGQDISSILGCGFVSFEYRSGAKRLKLGVVELLYIGSGVATLCTELDDRVLNSKY